MYRSGVILDGFPRNVNQADAVSNKIPIDLVMYFHLPRDVLIEKLMGRRVCPCCGRSYNVASIMNGVFNLPPLLPKEDNLCDNCHKPLIQRSDDRLDIIENRLSVYESQTAPILEYYGKNGKSASFVLSFICRCSSTIWYKKGCCRCARYFAIDDGSFYFVIVVCFSGMFVLVFIYLFHFVLLVLRHLFCKPIKTWGYKNHPISCQEFHYLHDIHSITFILLARMKVYFDSFGCCELVSDSFPATETDLL